tara:strand:- start:3878 stop:4132 length:255 start_codon:yes stop_codon:yes gene_type:complete
MKTISIYTSSLCNYCIAAKKIFAELNLNYNEINIDGNDQLRNKMIRLTDGRKTVPQIFFDDKLIGGYDDLAAIHKKGLIKELLK